MRLQGLAAGHKNSRHVPLFREAYRLLYVGEVPFRFAKS